MANALNIGLDRVKLEYDGVIPDTEEAYVQALVDKGVRVLLADCPGLLARVQSGATDRDLAEDAVVDAVLRVLRDDVGALEDGGVGLGVVGADGPHHRLDRRRRAVRTARTEPDQRRAHPRT